MLWLCAATARVAVCCHPAVLYCAVYPPTQELPQLEAELPVRPDLSAHLTAGSKKPLELKQQVSDHDGKRSVRTVKGKEICYTGPASQLGLAKPYATCGHSSSAQLQALLATATGTNLTGQGRAEGSTYDCTCLGNLHVGRYQGGQPCGQVSRWSAMWLLLLPMSGCLLQPVYGCMAVGAAAKHEMVVVVIPNPRIFGQKREEAVATCAMYDGTQTCILVTWLGGFFCRCLCLQRARACR